MNIHNIFNVFGLVSGAVASILIASNTYPEEPLLGQILEMSDETPNGNEENLAITARNKKRAHMRRIGFCGLVVSFALQLLAYVC